MKAATVSNSSTQAESSSIMLGRIQKYQVVNNGGDTTFSDEHDDDGQDNVGNALHCLSKPLIAATQGALSCFEGVNDCSFERGPSSLCAGSFNDNG